MFTNPLRIQYSGASGKPDITEDKHKLNEARLLSPAAFCRSPKFRKQISAGDAEYSVENRSHLLKSIGTLEALWRAGL